MSKTDLCAGLDIFHENQLTPIPFVPGKDKK